MYLLRNQQDTPESRLDEPLRAHELHPLFFKKRLIERENTLEEFLGMVDKEFGRRITAFLRNQSVSRVTIVPHCVLHVIPFWALPSFEGLDVRTAPPALR